eukprot:13484532-Heterocapsa_arctica.AAC.1
MEDVYATGRGAALGSYDLKRIRVCRGDLAPKEISTLVSGDAKKFIESPDDWIVKSDSELREQTDAGSAPARPYWDPV